MSLSLVLARLRVLCLVNECRYFTARYIFTWSSMVLVLLYRRCRGYDALYAGLSDLSTGGRRAASLLILYTPCARETRLKAHSSADIFFGARGASGAGLDGVLCCPYSLLEGREASRSRSCAGEDVGMVCQVCLRFSDCMRRISRP